MPLVTHIVGARPNFMKVAPVMRALSAHSRISQALIHTGQHYDAKMSDGFFRQLGLPTPDLNLGVGSGSHAAQTADVMTRLESALIGSRPDLLVVYGDVNSTLAAALVAAKLGIPLAHVEAGLRSFDRTMPEEINRIVTDRLADVLLTPSADGDENLLREGVKPEAIHRVGNVMIDSLVWSEPLLDRSGALARAGLRDGEPFALITLHRPATVDDEQILLPIVDALSELADGLTLLFPLHPRTRSRLEASGADPSHFRLLEPLDYFDFLSLEQEARVVVTDSGGVQEETTFFGVPCVTVRDNTERPITITQGTNVLVGRDPHRLLSVAREALARPVTRRAPPELWDGHAGDRIAEVLLGVIGA